MHQVPLAYMAVFARKASNRSGAEDSTDWATVALNRAWILQVCLRYIFTFSWPALSPDLLLIEHISDHIERQVRHEFGQNGGAFTAAVEREIAVNHTEMAVFGHLNAQRYHVIRSCRRCMY